MPLTDLLTTTDEDARSGADSISAPTAHPSPNSDRIDIKGFDIVSLSILWAHLANREWDTSFVEAFECVFEGFDDDGPWIYKVPEDFVDLLVQLQANSLKSAAEFWAQTEELARFDKQELSAHREGPFVHRDSGPPSAIFESGSLSLDGPLEVDAA